MADSIPARDLAGSLEQGEAPSPSPVSGFAAGTRLRTPGGDLPVESLRASDRLISADGAERALRRLEPCAWDRGGGAVEVVRIVEDAFAPGLPSRDLIVAPHLLIAVDVFDEMLVPAASLVNGATVVRERREDVTLWRVELDSHDLLIANSLPAGSALSSGSTALRLPLADRESADFVHTRLWERARALGWIPTGDDDLRLVVDGRVRRPQLDADVAVFFFPASARDVRLVSNLYAPGDFGLDDARVLGARLTGFVVSGPIGETRRISVDDPRLCNGVHDVEVEDGGRRFRWTTGTLILDPDLWAGFTGVVALLVEGGRAATRGWIAPPTRTPHT